MKLYSHRLLSFLLLSVFALSSLPTFAATVAPASTATGMNWQASENTTTTVKKKSEKRGFFSKVKAFGKKTKMFFKAAKAWVVAGDSAIVAILLAFFLGGLGIHRVYLGGRPLLILLYIITFGGIFGILPLIDFIRLIIGQMDHYVDNDAFFAAFQSAK